MRTRRYLRTLPVLLAVALLPALTVSAGGGATSKDLLAKAGQYAMGCQFNPPDWTCNQGIMRTTFAPQSGPVTDITTYSDQAPGNGMVQSSEMMMVDFINAVCLDPNSVGPFVRNVGALTKAGTVPKQTAGLCELSGGYNAGTLRVGFYYVTATVLAPTPTPTPMLKPTPKPTARPTAKPTPTASPTPTPSPTASPTATPSPTASPTSTPEQTVAGIAFTPEPTAAPPAPAGGGGGDWEGSVRSAGDVSTNGANLAGSVLAALLLLLAMGFIGELFNNTFEANYDRILAAWRKSWPGRLGKAFSGLWGGGS